MMCNGIELGARPDSVALPGERCEMRAAAAQFEGMLLSMILKKSLQETFGGSSGESSAGTEMMRDLCVETFSASLAETASLGLADQMVRQWPASGEAHEQP